MKAFATGVLALCLGATAMTASAQGPSGDTPGGWRLGPEDILRYDDVGPFSIAMRGDPWCGQTLAEVPDPPQLLEVELDSVGDALPEIVHNAMLVAVVQVNERGEIEDVVVKGGWPKSDQYVKEFRMALKNWRYASGHPGQYCSTLYIDVDGQVLALYRTPDEPAPKPLVATEIPYPELAYDSAIAGDVTLALDLGVNGEITDARVVKESPKGYGFGQAAVETVKSEWRFDGAVAGRYRLKLKFSR